MAGKHGGSRSGAGRKSKAEKHAGAVAGAEQRIADHLPELIENLLGLADGATQRVEEKWEPAGTRTIDEVATDRDGKPLLDPRGRTQILKRPAFPDKKPDEMILVERKVIVMGPDFRANEYLVNRVLGKPTERHEVSGEDGEPLVIRVEYADYLPSAPKTPPGAMRDSGGDEAI